ncbi:hypothetical protein QF002_008370 [Paraburkholderia youngii]
MPTSPKGRAVSIPSRPIGDSCESHIQIVQRANDGRRHATRCRHLDECSAYGRFRKFNGHPARTWPA